MVSTPWTFLKCDQIKNISNLLGACSKVKIEGSIPWTFASIACMVGYHSYTKEHKDDQYKQEWRIRELKI